MNRLGRIVILVSVLGFAGTPFAAPAGAVPVVGIIQDQAPWGTTANEQVIEQIGKGFQRVPTDQLGVVDLSQFDFLLLAGQQTSTSYQNVQNNLARIEAYVASGRTYIVHGAAFFVDNIVNYDLYPDAPGLTYVQGGREDVNLGAPHPINAGLTDAGLDNWNFSSHTDAGGWMNLPGGATVVLVDGVTGAPVYFTYGFGAGNVFVTGQPLEWGRNVQFMPDADTELRNEFLFAQLVARVPEPSVLLFFGSSLVGLGAAAWRYRRR